MIPKNTWVGPFPGHEFSHPVGPVVLPCGHPIGCLSIDTHTCAWCDDIKKLQKEIDEYIELVNAITGSEPKE